MEVSIILGDSKDIKRKIHDLRDHVDWLRYEFIVTYRGTEYSKWLSQQGDIQVILVKDDRSTWELAANMANYTNILIEVGDEWEYVKKKAKRRVARTSRKRSADRVLSVQRMRENVILHVSDFPDNTKGITKALGSMGDVETFNWQERVKSVGRHVMNIELMSKIAEVEPVTIFMEECFTGDILPSTIMRAKSRSTIGVVNWCGDMREEIPQSMIDLGPYIDWTLMSNEPQVKELLKLGIRAAYLPAGCATEIYTRRPADTDTFPEDIIFLGSGGRKFQNSALRNEVVNALHNKYGDRFAVYGRGWKARDYPWVKKFIKPEELESVAYSSCKIAIGVSAFNADGYTSARMWKAMGSGACYLPHRFGGIEKWFTQQQEVAWWNTVSELMSHIDYYLSRDADRKRMADTGMSEVHLNHSWESRMQAAMRLLNGRSIKVF